jgi:NTP pyrophosphatase (non-canonical NTP hydrolase)
MTGDFFQEAIKKYARQDLSGIDVSRRSLMLMNYALGITGEGGEVADEIKKVVFHDKPLDADKIINECGDVLWYIARLLTALDVPMSVAMERNVSKLEQRYGSGFDNAQKKFGFSAEEGA